MRELRGIPSPESLQRSCPVCFARPNEACTQPTDKGRRPVRWFHYKRLENE